MTNSLATAELAIYATLTIPILFILFRHGLQGVLGWFYLFAFCTLRLLGGALSMNTASNSGNLISNIGLSPLLLAASGILHEGRTYHIARLNASLEWTLVGSFHVLVATGVALLGVGASALQSNDPKASDVQMVEVGIAILTASWVVLCFGTSMSIRGGGSKGIPSEVKRAGKTIVIGVLITLPLIGIRVLYSLVALCTRKPYLNPVTGSTAIRVLLSLVPELIATLLFIAIGLRTRHIGMSYKEAREARKAGRE